MEILSLPYGVYRIGDGGEAVKRIQQVLLLLAYNIKVDSIYGEQTKGIILDIQKKYPESLISDGIYGQKTRSQLEKLLLSNCHIIQNPDNVLVLVNKENSLPQNYIPSDLVFPNVPFSFEEILPKKYMRKDAAIALEQLFQKAQQDDISLTAESGYRSYDRQTEIFTRNIKESPDANQTSARPGESEHQTGLSMDVSSPSVNNQLSASFGDTREGLWLAKNAADFGFIIRYPKDKENITGYQYEPWHLRYVGMPVSQTIAKNNLTLEEYLLKSRLPTYSD